MELTLRRQKTLFFLLSFRDPNDVQITWKNTGVIILEGGRLGSEGSKQTKAGSPKEGGPRGLCTWPRGAHQNRPRAPPRMGLFSNAFVSPKKERPNFPKSIRGRGGGETPDSLRGGSDPAAPELRRRGKSSSSSSPLLLGVGGGLYIITPIKTSTIIIIIITVIHSVPLAV